LQKTGLQKNFGYWLTVFRVERIIDPASIETEFQYRQPEKFVNEASHLSFGSPPRSTTPLEMFSRCEFRQSL